MTEGIRRQFKICLIGDGYVGKTSIRRQYLGSGFKASYLPTLGVDFAHTTVTYDDTKTQLVIWDIAGQPLFKSLRKRYYQGCSGIILVYSVVDRATFDNASKWLVEAHGFMGELPPVIVAANKIDLRSTRPEREIVSPAEGQAFTQKFSEELDTEAVFIETSALTGENIDKAFMKLTELMFQETEKVRRGVSEEAAPSEKAETPSAEYAATQDSGTAVSSSQDTTSTQLPDLDPVTSLVKDSEVLKQDEIGKQMAELLELRKELRNAEDELANVVSDYETKLLTLRNTIHVKKMMYEHLKRQISETRQEWAESYDEYMETEEKKKKAIAERSQQIEDLRKDIEKLGKRIRTRVSDLNLKKLAE
ncbi:MAG: GTP-binding protein [Candidatus Thorarchaeota archaeon]|nr:GTP-binding protein [Candidatus Thorarchaeota archaeon]